MAETQSSHLASAHRNHFGREPFALFRAPGRVNLIGEHTDYAAGFVFPAAINLGTTVAISPREDGRIVLYSQNFETEAAFEASSLPSRGSGQWHDYPLGVYTVLHQMGIRVPAFSITIAGNVPLGAGLSSSA